MDQRIIELLAKKLANEADQEELDELHDLLQAYPAELNTEDALNHIWLSKTQDEDVDAFYRRHKGRYADEFGIYDPLIGDDEDFSNGSKRSRALMVIFAIAIILAIGVVLYLTRSYREAPQYTQIIAAKGVRKSMRLPDDTKVWLNGDSKISFDSKIGDNEVRLVALNGEAYFEVAKDAKHPFVVTTDRMSIKVLGTSFQVSDYADNRKSGTALINGSLELTIRNDQQEKFMLKPWEKVSLFTMNKDSTAKITSANTTVMLEPVDSIEVSGKKYLPETSWMENKLVFNRETLEEIIPKLERWFNRKIEVEAVDGMPDKFSGAFVNESIEQVLKTFQLVKPFNFKKKDNTIIIY